MALPQIISRNQSQKIQSFEINGRVVIQPNTWYTCPTGKKALVKGRVQCTSRGAAANADFEVAGVVMYSWDNATFPLSNASNPINTPRALTTNGGGMMAFFEVELAAGDIIETTQNTGTNAEFNVWAEVIETDA